MEFLFGRTQATGKVLFTVGAANIPRMFGYMVLSPGRRKELEDRWRERLDTARHDYDVAVLRFDTVLSDQIKHPLPAPDGSRSVRLARCEESAARNEYMRLLRIFTDLIVHGTIPEEP